MKINGVLFTKREVDIIACIINGRRTKMIGDLLDLSVRTISVHIANILRKIDKNSQEQIISFIENNNLHTIFRKRYLYIVYAQKFKLLLNKLPEKCLIKNCYLYNLKSEEFVYIIRKSFELLGCNVIETNELQPDNISSEDILIAPISDLKNVTNSQCRKIYVLATLSIITSCGILLDYDKEKISNINFWLLTSISKN